MRRRSQDTEIELHDEEVLRLRDALRSIPDHREEKNPLYPLDVVITMLVYSVLCGYHRPSGADSYCKLHVTYFTELFGLKRTPSFPTFSKVLKVLDPAEIAAILPSWVETCSHDIQKKYEDLCIIHARAKKERATLEKIELELRNTEIDSLCDALSVIPDHRKARGVRYPLIALLVMMIYSALCGYTKSEDMELYCRNNAAYFMTKFNLERTPSHDTFDRLKILMNPMNVAVALMAWIEACYPDTKERFQNLLILHVDGKAIRAASNKESGEAARYLLNAMYEGESIGMRTQEVGTKRNEASVIPEFLDNFNLHGTIVTADAAATTEPVITKIINSGGQYVLPIKGNQGKTQDMLIEKCSELLNTPAQNPAPGVVTMYDELEHVVYKPKRNHGRNEEITCVMIDAQKVLSDLLKEKPFLRTAKYVVVIDKTIKKVENNVEITTFDRRMFITSLENITPEDVRKIIAGHWHIEMNHWLLDIQLREDSMTSWKGHSMEFGAMLRRLVLTLWHLWRKGPKDTLHAFLIHNQSSMANIERVLLTAFDSSAIIA